jgi:chromosomal replication initiation ATPase DnaA
MFTPILKKPIMTIDEAKELIEKLDHQQRVLKRWVRIHNGGYNMNKLEEEDVIDTVCQVMHLSRSDVKGRKRHRKFVLARQIIMYIINVRMNRSTTYTGSVVNRDHSTCIYSVNSIKGSIELYKKRNIDNQNVVSTLRECEEKLSIQALV